MLLERGTFFICHAPVGDAPVGGMFYSIQLFLALT